MTQRKRILSELDGFSRVVFDLDGTLYDTRDYERPALASVAGWLRAQSGQALETLPEALWQRRETNRHYTRMFDDILKELGLPAGWSAECVRRFRDYAGHELRSSQSLKTELQTLRDGGCRLALVSNGRASIQERKVHMLGMSELFDLCIFCDPRSPDQLKPCFWAWSQLKEWRAGYACVHVGDDPVDAAFAAVGGAQFLPFMFRSSFYEN